MIVVCGESLVDLVPDGAGGTYTPHPGGSPANVAVGIGRLDVPVALLSRLADDGFGRLLRGHLAASGVELGSALRSGAPTTLAVLTLDGAGRADYSFYVDGCADGGWRPEQLPPTLPDGPAMHVSGSLALAVPAMGDTMEVLLRREAPRRTLMLDPNLRPSLVRDPGELRTRLDRWLGLIDVLKLSAEDADWLAPGEPVQRVAERLRRHGAALVVVTRGADGVHAVGPGGTVDLPGEAVEVVDTVGAGDAFSAGLLVALSEADRLDRARLPGLSTAELAAALAFAQHVAALTCARPGADPPRRSELDAAARH